MLFEPGPLAFLDPERLIPRPLAFGFEALAGRVHGDVEGAAGVILAQRSIMASDLTGAPAASLTEPLARAVAAHVGSLAGDVITFAGELQSTRDLDEELAFVQGHFPAEGGAPALPAVTDDPSNVFTEGAGDVPPPPPPPPPPASGGGGGGGGGDTGGGGGGGGLPGTRELLELYMQENPSERPRIEQFLRDNPGDYDRAPAALNLPGWAEFVARHS